MCGQGLKTKIIEANKLWWKWKCRFKAEHKPNIRLHIRFESCVWIFKSWNQSWRAILMFSPQVPLFLKLNEQEVFLWALNKQKIIQLRHLNKSSCSEPRVEIWHGVFSPTLTALTRCRTSATGLESQKIQLITYSTALWFSVLAQAVWSTITDMYSSW